MEAISISLNTISERGVYTHTSLAYPAICQSRKDPGIRVSKHDSHPSLSEHPQVLESIFPLSFTQQGTCSQPYPPTHIRAPGATIRAPLPASSHNTIDLCRGFLLLLPSPPTFLMHPCHPLSGHCALRCRQWTVWVPQDHYQAALAQLLFCLQPHLAHQMMHLLHDAFQK